MFVCVHTRVCTHICVCGGQACPFPLERKEKWGKGRAITGGDALELAKTPISGHLLLKLPRARIRTRITRPACLERNKAGSVAWRQQVEGLIARALDLDLSSDSPISQLCGLNRVT